MKALQMTRAGTRMAIPITEKDPVDLRQVPDLVVRAKMGVKMIGVRSLPAMGVRTIEAQDCVLYDLL